MAGQLHYPSAVNEARRQLIDQMRETFTRESDARIVEIVDWMIDNEWVSDQYYRAVSKGMGR